MVDVGSVLAGRYELVEVIGRGGMAQVFRAADRVLERDVAVKVLMAHRADEASFRSRFRKEARSAASLNHPNVVTVHDSGVDGDAHYIVMEYVDGPSLQDVIQREGSLAPGRAVDITGQVLAALAAAHAAGLVHRDVKPGNILFNGDGTVKVTDFGIVRAIESATTTTATVYGSAPYLSPEQARNEHVDARSDLYAVGCVLYLLLTGRQPYTATEPLSVIYQHLHDDPPRPSEDDPAVPRELDAVVLRALAKHPGERFVDAAMMQRALLEAATSAGLGDADETAVLDLDGEPTVALGTPAPASDRTADREADDAAEDPAPDWLSRPGRLVVLGVALAAVIVAGVVALRAGDDSSPAASVETPVAPTAAAAVAAPSPTPTSTPTPSPTPTTVTLDTALTRFLDVVEDGRASGEIDDKAAEELSKRGDEMLQAIAKDDPDEALSKLRDAQDKLGEFVEKGEMSAGLAQRAAAALDRVEVALIERFAGGTDDRPDDHPGRGRGNNDEDD